MSPDAVRILEASIQWLHPSVRDNVSRRYVSMVREFEYIVAKGSDDLRYLRIQKGWVDQKFYALFALNSFYQIAIGPHQASANTSGNPGVSDLCIRRGSESFGWGRKKRVDSMVEDFMSMVGRMGFSRSWLSLNTCGDLIYWVARREREEEPFTGPGNDG